MPIDIFTNDWSRMLISIPFLVIFYGSIFSFILNHKNLQIIFANADIDNTDTDTDDNDTHDDNESHLRSNTKFNNEYEKKYIDKLATQKKEYVFTSDEKSMLAEKLNYETMEKAEELVINHKLEKLLNSYIIETTPLGNVIMRYNFKSEAFEFYSDNTIPYRYLECAARKYVLTNQCIPLYVDMAEILKESELKMVEEEEIRVKKEKEKEINGNNNQSRNVFATLKNYNKPSFSTSVKQVPPKNNIRTDTNPEKKVILKERTNRYSYQGKMMNCSFLQKVDKKLVNKKQGMTFADFKLLKSIE